MLAIPAASAARALAQPTDIPSPLKGLVLNKATTELGPRDAIRLDNWACRTDGLTVRDGYTVAATGHGVVRHMMALGPTLYSASDAGIKPVAGLGAAATIPEQATRWGSAVIANGAGTWLLAASGTYPPLVTNGSVWLPVSITAPPAGIYSTAPLPAADPSKLCNPVVWNGRVWFYERGTLRLWYLDHGALMGPARPVYLDALCREGGEIVAIAVLSGDGGSNPDDRLVVVTSRGEMILYAGDDPNDSAKFSFQGVYTVPLPVGYRPFAELGGELAYLSVNGLYTVPSLLPGSKSKQLKDGLSEPIRPELVAAIAAAPDDPSWSVLDSGETGLVMINAPGGVQYVFAPETGGWSRFTGLAATAWCEIPGGLYFGRADGVIARHHGTADNGAAIQSVLISGWMRASGIFHRVRQVYLAAQPYRARIEMLRDYTEPSASYAITYTDSGFWNWPDLFEGNAGQTMTRPVSNRLGQWRGISGHCYDAAAFVVAMKSTTRVVHQKLQVMIEKRGGL